MHGGQQPGEGLLPEGIIGRGQMTACRDDPGVQGCGAVEETDDRGGQAWDQSGNGGFLASGRGLGEGPRVVGDRPGGTGRVYVFEVGDGRGAPRRVSSRSSRSGCCRGGLAGLCHDGTGGRASESLRRPWDGSPVRGGLTARGEKKDGCQQASVTALVHEVHGDLFCPARRLCEDYRQRRLFTAPT